MNYDTVDTLEPGFYDHFDALGEKLFRGIDDLFQKHGRKGHCKGLGARFAIYFGVENPEDDYDFRKIAGEFDRAMDKKFVTLAQQAGLWFHDTSSAITPAHRALLTAHTPEEMDITLNKMDDIFAKL